MSPLPTTFLFLWVVAFDLPAFDPSSQSPGKNTAALLETKILSNHHPPDRVHTKPRVLDDQQRNKKKIHIAAASSFPCMQTSMELVGEESLSFPSGGGARYLIHLLIKERMLKGTLLDAAEKISSFKESVDQHQFLLFLFFILGSPHENSYKRINLAKASAL